MDWTALALSLKLAGATVALLLPLGLWLGRWIARTPARWKIWVEAAMLLPLVLPPTVLGYYLLVVVGRRGWLGNWLDESFGIQLVFTWQGAVIAAALVTFPLVFKPARAAFESVDAQFEQAARTLGLPEWAVFLRITLPLAWRGILAGLLLSFARAMGEFGATLMVAGSIPGKTQTLSVAIYAAVQAGDDRSANLLALVTAAVCVAMLLVASRLNPPRQVAP